MSENQKWRNAPVYMNCIAHVDLTDYPIKIQLETPKLLFGALNIKKIETEKVSLEFVEAKER